MTTTDRPEPAVPVGTHPNADNPIARPLAIAAAVASAVVAALGIAWLVAPSTNPLGEGALASVGGLLLGSGAAAAVAVAAGLTGVVAGTTMAVRRTGAGAIGVAAVLAAVLIVDLGSVMTVAFAGYLFGCVAVVAGLATVAVTLVRAPRLGLALLVGVVAIAVAAAWWAGLRVDGITDFAARFAGALAGQWPRLAVVAIVLATATLWAGAAIAALRTGGPSPFERGLVRHRRALTILAALGPLPYAVARASWLTPWPLFGPSSEEMTPSVLATGLILGSGAVAAGILTLGLILPWGTVFPRWMPRVGGRPVPVLVAAAPGFGAAAILIVAAPAMFTMSVGGRNGLWDVLLLNLVLPLWFWGPALLLAVWAYVGWRAGDAAADPIRQTVRRS